MQTSGIQNFFKENKKETEVVGITTGPYLKRGAP